MTTFLRPFSSKRAELERRLASDEITARPSRDYGSLMTRLRLTISMLLLLTLGSSSVWGQDDYPGVYYIKHNADATYYLCTSTVFYDDNHYANSGDMPYLTTATESTITNDGVWDKDAVWRIIKAESGNYYYVVHAVDGKYLTLNDDPTNFTNNKNEGNRLSLHLQYLKDEEKSLFIITKSGNWYNITPKTKSTWSLNPAGNNYDTRAGHSDKKQNIAGAGNNLYVGGLIGLWMNDNANSKWQFVEVTGKPICEAPTFTNNGSLSISCSTTGANIYYTTDGSTVPTTSSTNGNSITVTEEIDVVWARATTRTSEPYYWSPLSVYEIPQCATPVISITNGKLNLSCTTDGATLYYVINGLDPTTEYDPNNKPDATENDVIKAVATKNGYHKSNVVSVFPSTQTVHNTSEMGNMFGNYILASDFVVSSSVGTEAEPFCGVIDGGLNTFSDFDKALVAYANGATIKNVILDNVNIGENANGYAGAICCEASGDTRIYNCGVKSGTISGTNAGSIVGKLDGNARVINCYSFATVSGGTWGAGIVGYNSFSSTRSDLRTMVMNCMFYGEISSNSKLSPIYGGEKITNVSNLNGYNYYRFNANYSKNNDITDYNCALAAEEDYLTRFEFFRNTLNSNRELAAWYATDNPNDGKGIGNACKMAKWVLDPADKPYPILKAQDYYPSFINYEDAPNLGTIDLTINESNTTTGGEDKPNGASINSNYPTTLTVYDKDLTHKHFNYRTVRLPYYNEVGTGNCTHNKVVTGWKITGFSGGTQGHFVNNTLDYSGTTHDEDEYPPYNFADRYCTDKDKYAVSGRVFSQGAYYDVPEGVTGITIEPYWGAAVYLSDPTYDVAYPEGYGDKNVNAVFVSNMGSRYVGGNTAFINDDNQTVYTDYDSAFGQVGSSGTVYDNAIVLVGNYHHYWGQNSPSTTKAFTIMSADLNNDCEPDYSFIVQHGTNRQDISAIRFDFINSPGLGMIQKVETDKAIPKHGIWYPKGWFEVTNTTLIQFTQFEYDKGGKPAGSPLILLGGIYDQFVTSRYNAANSTEYIHLGGNIWMKEFCNGTHTANTNTTRHIPISVTGGEFESFYLTGTFRPSVESVTDNAECYINGGKFGDMAGAGQEQLKGDVTWLIDHADITNFYGGGINDQKPVLGHIYVEINNSNVGLYCGGPKFGNMQDNMKVTTKAKGSTFGNFYGAGYGGTSYFRDMTKDKTGEKSWDTWNSDYTRKYVEGKGISTEYEYEFIPYSGGESGQADYVGRFYVLYASLSLAKTKNVESTLEDCHITGSFYGGGKLGSVDGNITSTLKNCTVDENVFGAGFSASVEKVNVVPKGALMKANPAYNESVGVFTDGVYPDGVPYTWTQAASVSAGHEFDDTNHLIYTTTDLTSLGTVTGKVTLNIEGTTTVKHSVYGGGEESGVEGNTIVNITGGTIGTTGKGGATWGNVYGGGKGKADDVTAGIVKGSTNVSISGSPTILHNVYGGGAYGSVGTFSYDATTGFPTGWTTTDDKGKCSVSITGGTIGTTGDNNGMVFGSSRGLEGNPSNPNVDKMAWVYDTDVTIGIQNAQSNATPWIKGSVYGGGENGHNFHDAKVTVHSGTIGILEGAEIIDDRGTPDDDSDDISYSGARFPNRGNVYGSGCGTDTYTADGKTYFDFNAGIVRGNTTVQIDGGHVVHNVYGGGAMGSVGTYTFADAAYHVAHPEVPVGKPISCEEGTGTCTVTVSGGQIGVTGAKMAGYGKGGPDDFGHVFGAGRGEMHDPDQYPNVETCAFFNKTILNISGTAFLTGSAYGGSESGHVLGDTEVNISGGQIGCGKNATKPYGSDVWADSYTPTGSVTESLDCASWPFESPFAPYDPFANATGDLDKYPNGHSTDGGRLEASDGHTYYGNVFGGGSGSVPYFDTTDGISKYLSTAGSVEGKTTINITGGHIITNVYGGCEATNVKGSATITMTGGTVGVPRTVAQIIAHPNTGYIFGAGKGDQRIFFNKETNVDRTAVNIVGGRVYGSIFGGGEDGHVFQNAIVNIGKTGEDGPIIGTSGTSYVDGNVFGGGRGFGGEALTAGNIGGSIELNIKSGKILGSVYGGGRLGSVGYGLYLTSEEGYGILRPDDEYDGSYPNPSTEEASTYYNKGRGYIVINISGGTIGNDAEYIYNPTAEQKAAIPNTTFDYQNHLQYTKGGNVFTGGMGRLYALDNTTLLPLWPKLGKCKGTTLNMTGGTVKSSIYGGGEIGAVAKNATVNVNGGTVGTKVVDPDDNTKYYYFGSVFGGGKGSTANVEGISEAGTTGGNVAVNLNEGVAENKKGAIVSQVFGCNDMNGSPKGTVTVHVYSTQTAENADIATKPEKGTDTYDVMAVYGGGNLAAYEPTDLSTGKTNVIIDGCGLTSVRQVYGGGNAASTPATDVEINGSYEILELFGGGNGADKLPTGADNPGANVGYKDYHLVEDQYPTKEERVSGDDFAPYRYGTGEATVNIKGGTIHRVFGGSNTKGNVRKTALTMLEEVTDAGVPKCKFEVDEAYGGGKSAPMDAEAQLHMACIPGLKEAYGGAEAADIQGDVTLNITNGTFDRVFGGNNISGTIRGSIKVNIEEVGCKPIIIGELYGGGNQAGYSVYGYDGDGKPIESGNTPLFADPVVNVRSFTSIGSVYGGGYGETAVMVGNPTVNINVGMGGQTNHDAAEIPEGTKLSETYPIPSHKKGKIGAINNVYGGGNAAKVLGDATVNIGVTDEETLTTVTNNPATPVDESKLTVVGADIRGNVYGGGNNAEVTGNTNVTIGKKNE
ncbi:MAG: chitobiase/beta-hexosaminidase C-terminal domain-containing protein [Prevotella sp.]|nr:chitobiase/beta-hexosaminidase C-terminal domain-containing protein [Prevotella sp.]